MLDIKLTQYSHGAGCGCKISPKTLSSILKTELSPLENSNLLVGNESSDDAAVYDLGNGTGIISTTDFFMPIVDDPFTFGRIAATNALSDVYAMGGTPIMAIAILGWPIDKIEPEIAQKVLEGGRTACHESGITLAGGHSIDSPEPIFGLAVTGTVDLNFLKRNNDAKAGDKLYLTKPLGIGVLTTAEKKGVLREDDKMLAIDAMCKLNTIGEKLSRIKGVHALTDVTGFGLLGHLKEVCVGSDVSADIRFSEIPRFAPIDYYIDKDCIPGGTHRNWDSYGCGIRLNDDTQKKLLCDPQTSGGLLISVSEASVDEVEQLLQENELYFPSFGELKPASNHIIEVD